MNAKQIYSYIIIKSIKLYLVLIMFQNTRTVCVHSIFDYNGSYVSTQTLQAKNK